MADFGLISLTPFACWPVFLGVSCPAEALGPDSAAAVRINVGRTRVRRTRRKARKKANRRMKRYHCAASAGKAGEAFVLYGGKETRYPWQVSDDLDYRAKLKERFAK